MKEMKCAVCDAETDNPKVLNRSVGWEKKVGELTTYVATSFVVCPACFEAKDSLTVREAIERKWKK